jgi:hypothetical protein
MWNPLKKLLNRISVFGMARGLEPGKIYCVRINSCDGSTMELCRMLSEELRRFNISVIFTSGDVDFVDIPKGYELRRTE